MPYKMQYIANVWFPDLPEMALLLSERKIYLKDHITKWCEDNLKEKINLSYQAGNISIEDFLIKGKIYRTIIIFKNVSDMIAFKLRWL